MKRVTRLIEKATTRAIISRILSATALEHVERASAHFKKAAAALAMTALLLVLAGCGGDVTVINQQPAPEIVNPCACEYELVLLPSEMRILCKPCLAVQ